MINKYFKKIKRRVKRLFWFFFLLFKLKMHFKNNDIKNGFWDDQYSNDFIHHSHQNKMITQDFINVIKHKKVFMDVCAKSKTLVDFGCGTGELSYFFNKKFHYNKIIGLDISKFAISIATKLWASDVIKFKQITPDEDLNKFGHFDLLFCSNTLEHFKNPFLLVRKMLGMADYIVIIVPYSQPVIDQYIQEGGSGHVFCFNESSFSEFNVLDYFVFSTLGWDYSSCGEEPLEIAYVIKK